MIQKRIKPILQCGREITIQELSEIEETVKLFPKLSQGELASTICEHLEWRTASGGYKTDACIKLLKKLEKKGALDVPIKTKRPRTKPKKSVALTSRTEPQADIVGDLKDIGLVKVEIVMDTERTALWNEYVSRYHYLDYKKPFGCFLRYFVECERGLLGCIMFGGASKAMTIRDHWIGWSEIQRLQNIAWVINNWRFLIFPWVRVKNLGSHTLGQVMRRVRDDWEERWGYSPVLAETFIDPQHYEGISYKAANWQYLGTTTGEGLVRKGKIYTTTPKRLFTYPLAKNFRELLCSSGQLKGREDEEL